MTSPTTASTSEFAASYSAVLAELAFVRSRHAELTGTYGQRVG